MGEAELVRLAARGGAASPTAIAAALNTFGMIDPSRSLWMRGPHLEPVRPSGAGAAAVKPRGAATGGGDHPSSRR